MANSKESALQTKGAILLEAGEYAVVVRKPGRADYKAFRADIFREDRKDSAVERALESCLLWPVPNSPEWESLCESFPAAPDVFGAAVSDMMGVGMKASQKKA